VVPTSHSRTTTDTASEHFSGISADTGQASRMSYFAWPGASWRHEWGTPDHRSPVGQDDQTESQSNSIGW
jgi:hypothetical protein